MKKQLVNAKNFIKQNKLPLMAAVAAVAVVSVPAYAHQAKQASKKQEVARVEQVPQPEQKSEVKAEQTTTVEPTPAPAPAPAPKPAAAPAPKKTEPAKPVEKKTQPSYETVSMTLVRSGGSVVATIGTSKPGTCYLTFKDYTDPNNPKYASVEGGANGGSCTVSIPAGTWTHVAGSYKAADYTAKGSSSKIAL